MGNEGSVARRKQRRKLRSKNRRLERKYSKNTEGNSK